MSAPPSRPHVAVVGGGIAGLAAAWALRREPGNRVRVTVLEAASAVGGKLRVTDVGGVPVDDGAESMLARRPEGVGLARALGLADDLVHPSTTQPALWSRGALRPLPTGTLLGVPGDLRALAASGVLTLPELARVPLDDWRSGAPLREDVAIGEYVGSRVGRAVVDRLVEPLLGGVYAGCADAISLEMALPPLYRAARHRASLLAAVREVHSVAAPRGTPVFASVRGGLGRLPGVLAAALAASPASGRPAVEVRTATTVRALRRTPSGWRLTIGPTRSPEALDVDAVVLAVPARAAARLLAHDVPGAAAVVATVEYASVGLVTLVLPGTGTGPTVLAQRSGFLVPPVEGRVSKAATFTTTKWAWAAEAAQAAYGPHKPHGPPGAPQARSASSSGTAVVVRLSVGRHGEERDLQRDDVELVDLARAELTAATGVAGVPLASRVTRWGGALPQYRPGHRALVQRVRAAVARQPGLAVCGAAYDGVGVPACIASGEDAAARLLATLGQQGE
jgi:oxygen-dependent protoporphyrinogen oxidase